MSRKIFIVALAVAVLVATLVAPAVTVLPEVDDAVPVEVGVWPILSASSSVATLPIRLDGDCESAGASGCPNPG